MAFNILTIRTGDHDDGSLYPVLGAERDEVEFEPLDGRSVTRLFAEAAYIYRIVGNGIHEEAHVSDIRMAVYITDARVAVACSKYDKGGGWRGSLIAVPLNAVSMARAAYRRQGKMLVGHVRYPWLASVAFTEKSGWGSSNCLRLQVTERIDGNDRNMMLELRFPKGTDTASLAHVISQRAAAYRLAHDHELSATEVARFEALRSGAAKRGTPKEYTVYAMPTEYFVSASSAYPKKGVVQRRVDTPVVQPSPAPVAEPASSAPAATTALPPPQPAAPAPAVQPLGRVVAPLSATPSTAPAAAAPAAAAPQALPTPAPQVSPTPTHAVAGAVPSPARWAEDPFGRHELRYWDGARWSEHVSDAGQTATDVWPR